MEKTAEQLRREHIALEGDTHGKNKWAILFTVLVMTFMACLDASIVTVALPVMQKELGVGLDRIQLVSSVYLLATCVAMLPFGRLGDVRGKVNVFQLGVIVFTGGSLLCGLSASLEVLILARFVQGIGCAAAMANNMGIITESFPARERGRAHGHSGDLCGSWHDVRPRARRRAGGELSLGEHLPYQSAHWRNLVYRGTLYAAACEAGGWRTPYAVDRGGASLLCELGFHD